MNNLKSSLVGVENGTVGKKKKKKKKSKTERRRNRRKRELEVRRIPVIHNKHGHFSYKNATNPDHNCNRNLDSIIKVKSTDDHDTSTIEQSINPNATERSKSTILSKDNFSNFTTKQLPSSSPLVPVPSPEECPPPPPLKDSLSSFGSSTEFSSFKNRVEFVYPKNHQTGGEGNEGAKELSLNSKRKRINYKTSLIIPYVHTKLQKKAVVGDETIPGSSIERTSRTKDEQKSKLLIEEEDIDDILYPERKQKRIQESERIKSAQDKVNTELTRRKNKPETVRPKTDNGETKPNGLKEGGTPLQTDTEKEDNDGDAIFLQNGDRKKQITKKTHRDDTLTEQTLVISGKQAREIHKLDEEKKRQKKKKLSIPDIETSGEGGSADGMQNGDKKKHSLKIKRHNDAATKQARVVKGEQGDAIHKLNEENEIQKKILAKKSRSMSEDIDDITKGKSTRLLKRQLSGLTVEDALKDKVGRRPRCNSTDRELNLPQRGLCDEHMVLESHRWNVGKLYGQSSKSNSNHFASPRGFINLGNTCFLNATLQCLAHLPTFCQCVAVMPPPNDSNSAVGALSSQQKGHNGGGKKQKISNGQRFTINLRVLLRKMHGLDGGKVLNHDPVAPKEIVRSLSQLGGSNRGHKFRPGRQEDAHEFLVHLMDMMHDGELKAAGIDQKKSGWRNSIPIPRLEETTVVHRMFGGYLRSQVKCTRCQYSSNTYDPFLDLSLEISANNVKSISTAFAQFTRKETLDTDNKWKCSGCKQRVCATKQLTCFRPPLSLCIQLKRFTFSAGGHAGAVHHKGGWGFGHFSGKGMGMARGGSKSNKPIEFPALLKLPLSDGRKCDYELTGIVIHVGGSATSGHYTAYVRRPNSHGDHNNNWYHMDDSYVKPVSEKTVLKQKDAYLLFYCRKEVKLEIPSPPPRSIMNAGEAQKMAEARAKARANSDLECIPETEQNAGEISREVQRLGVERSSARVKSSVSEDISQNKDTRGKAQAVGETRTRDKTKSNPIDDTITTKHGKGETTTDSSNCDNIEKSLTVRESNNSNKNEMNKNGEYVPNGLMERSSEGNISILDNDTCIAKNDTCIAKNSNYEESARNNAEVDGKKKEANRKKKVLSVDIGQRGSVQVILNNPSKKKKKWKPTTSSTNTLLLGNVDAKGWDDEVCSSEKTTSDQSMNKVNGKADLVRRMALQDIVQKEKSRKRKMYPDKWDAGLDKGKTKKVKVKLCTDPQQYFEPKDNPFQRMQLESMQNSKGVMKKYPSLKKKNTFSNKKHFQKP